MRIVKQIKAALPSGKLAVVAVLLMALALGVFKFWDWIKYRVGVITVAMAMLSLNEWAVLTGIFCTIGTFFCQLVLRAQKVFTFNIQEYQL